MLFLVTDTSGRNGSVALARAVSDDISLIESVPLAGGTFSAQMVPQISALLSKHGFGKGDPAAFIVVAGPGSFTGLRVGLAAIKALAEILKKPIIPVSLLEVVATAGAARGRVLAALDAGRGEVYVGEYEVAGPDARATREMIVPREEFLSLARNCATISPDEALVAHAREAGVAVRAIPRPDAASIARLGWKKLQSGHSVTPEQLDANYIRRSDAEIFSKSSS